MNTDPLLISCKSSSQLNLKTCRHKCPVCPQAANPGCVLEDFVRWYSPRDYVVEEVVDEMDNKVVKGELSARMKIPGNMWVEAWETARVTPARRQRRLFDDTKEAEKVISSLPGWYTYNWHQEVSGLTQYFSLFSKTLSWVDMSVTPGINILQFILSHFHLSSVFYFIVFYFLYYFLFYFISTKTFYCI